MDNINQKTRIICAKGYMISKIVFYALIALTGLVFIYTVVMCFLPGKSFIVSQATGGLDIHYEPMLFWISPEISNISLSLVDASSAKILYVFALFSSVLLTVPFIFVTHYIKDTFFNIAYGNIMFTKESVYNTRIVGFIFIGMGLFATPLYTLITSLSIGKPNVNIKLDIVFLLCGGLALALSFAFAHIEKLIDSINSSIPQDKQVEAPTDDINIIVDNIATPLNVNEEDLFIGGSGSGSGRERKTFNFED